MSASRVKVATFNLRGALSLDGQNIWPRRLPLVLAFLRNHRPDIVGFQEAHPINLRGLRQWEQRDWYKGCRSGNRIAGPYNPISWATPGLSVVEQGSFFLSDTPDVRSRSWGSRHIRTCVWAEFQTGTSRFRLYNVHLDNASQEARLEAVKLVIEVASATQLPTVILGDFNHDPAGPVYDTLLSHGYSDSWCAAGHAVAEGYTIHRFTGERLPDEGRIDWVFVSEGIAVQSARIVYDSKLGPGVTYASDHFPVVVELEI